jgi:ribosomal protein S18 acetylase RimI-like enzyme
MQRESSSLPSVHRIRPARPEDHAAIADFNARLAIETERKTLDPAVLHRGVAAALADPDRLRYWVAEAGGSVVGQAAVTREWSDWRNGWIWWLQSVYIHPDQRRRGILRAMLETIRATAKAEGNVIGLRLYVEDQNTRAQKTYQSLGLEPGGYHVYEDLWIKLDASGRGD